MTRERQIDSLSTNRLSERPLLTERKMENGKNAIGLISKSTILHVHQVFLYISLPSLHDYDRRENAYMFVGRREDKTTTFFFFS